FLRADPNSGKLQTLLTHDVFGIIRSLTPFRLTGGSKDYIIVGSDSGRIVILEYNPAKNKFDKIHQETFGKSGCRRIVPGQYLAVDPKGRSVMIGAIEKQKLVYILNRDSAANLTISSPLEAHKSHTLVHHCIGLDVGFDNPVFACLEVDYSEADLDHTGEAFNNTEKMLTYYELDLGLNHVVRKWSDPVDARANMLFAEDPSRGLIIVAGVMHKMKGVFFFLLQSEEGDIYKVTLDYEDDKLQNLERADELESLNPLIDAKVPFFNFVHIFNVLNLTDDDTPQLYALCGRGSGSTFRILRHGLEVSEMAVSELPGNPNAVWTTKLRSDDEFDAYIIVSFVNATLVLSIGETVEEVTDTGFLATTPTLDVHQLGDDALLQIYPQGLRHIRADRRVNEWKTPGNRAIVKATTNKRQVVIALTGGELVYFELDNQGQLNEYQERKEMTANVHCLSIGEVPEGRQRSRFLAVGCDDNAVRILSLDPDNTLEVLSTQGLSAPPQSLSIIEMMDIGTDASHGTLYLNIGLQNGVLLRTVLDTITGALTDTRQSYTFQSRLHLTPLSYDMLEYGSNFTSPQVPEGIVAISANTLRIFAVEKLGTVFNQATIQLKYTPRHFILHPISRNFVIIESEHNTFSPAEKEKALEAKVKNGFEYDPKLLELPPETFGLPKAEHGKWASCIRVLNPFQGETMSLVELEENEAAFRLIAGVGKALRIYDMGNRIIVCDMQESVHYASYRPHDNRIIIFADDTTPRWITTTTMIDYDTLAGGDKFGDFFVDRLPAETSEEVDEDPTGNKIMYEKGYLMGAPHKVSMIVHYHVGDIITSLHRTTLVAGGREILTYTGVMAGRDHLQYRSFYAPVKSMVDGDLCEQYNLLPMDKKKMIAEELDRTPAEIQKKIEDMREFKITSTSNM
ncbi:129_t:CDS:10, partial [Racocetra fulgida]